VSNKTPNHHDSQYSIKNALENLRSFIVDMEAVANAAADTLQHLPYIPRSPRRTGGEPEDDVRLNFGRLHALVTATSSNARKVLQEINEIIERLYHRPTSDNGSSKAGEAWRPRLYGARSEDTAVEPVAMLPVRSRKLA
jgi:hypothetical protein